MKTQVDPKLSCKQKYFQLGRNEGHEDNCEGDIDPFGAMFIVWLYILKFTLFSFPSFLLRFHIRKQNHGFSEKKLGINRK